ncbi:MAG: hypothetical protein QM811_05270 [Pirellulales bacterium]
MQEFEKVCLESDIQLAEVADCHQILALVLGQPAEVDPHTRRKMYEVILKADDAAEPPLTLPITGKPSPAKDEHPVAGPGLTAATTATTASAAAPLPTFATPVAATAHPAAPDSPERHVPEYLLADRRAHRRTLWWMIAAAILVLVGVARLIGPFDSTNPLIAWAVAKDPSPLPKTNDGKLNPEDKIPDSETPAMEPNVASKSGEKIGAETATTDPMAPVAPKSDTPVPAVPVPETPAITPATPMPAEIVTTDGKTPPPLPMPPGTPTGTPDVGTAAVVTTTPAGANPATPVPPAPMPSSAAPTAPAIIGRMSADGTQVLLNWKDNVGGGSWVRVLGTGTVATGDRLLSLHTYRPAVTLGNGVMLQMIGETQLELFTAPQGNMPLIRLHFGKIVLYNSSTRPDAKIAIEPGVKRTGILTLNDVDSVAALEVVRALPAGGNPETVAALVGPTLYAVQGHFQWQPDTTVAAPAPAAGPLRRPLNGEPAGTPVDNKIPVWVTKNELSGYDSQASSPLQQFLNDTQPVAVTLRELAGGNRRAEIRYLAARSLALIDEFDLFIDSFSDPDQKAVWSKEIEALQAALARSPETAAMVRQSFVKQRPDYGEKLYRYLWGFTREDLVGGFSDELLDGLDNDNLDMRVIAYNTLREAVRDPKSTAAPPTYNFVPDATSIQARQQSARQWRANIKELIKRLPQAAATAPPAVPATPTAPATLDQLP